jgi:integrase
MTALDTRDRSKHTTSHYRGDLRRFAKWWGTTSQRTLTPGAITPEVLERWLKHLREDALVRKDGRKLKRKPATINAKRSALKAFLFWARKAGIIKHVPELPPRARLGARPVKALDPRQQRRLIQEVELRRRPRDLAIILILIETGMRVAELVALEWRDLVLKQRKGWFTVRSGKGRKSRGPLVLSVEAFTQFTLLRQADPGAGPEEQVFRSQRENGSGDKQPLTVRGVQQLLCRYAERLGWDHLHPHQLRHCFGQNARRKNPPMDWPVIARYMGHSSVKTTMDHYGTPSDHDIEVALGVDQLDDD